MRIKRSLQALLRGPARRRERVEKARTAIAWLTHFHDPEGQGAFARLASQAAGVGPVVQFRDGFGHRADDPPFDIVSLTEAEIAAAAPTRYREWTSLVRRNAYGGGLTDVVMLAIAIRLSDFEHIWIVEADADFTGDWRTFFQAFDREDADLLATNLWPYRASGSWFHWRWFEAPSAAPRRIWTRGFFPVARLSRRFVNAYLEEVPNGWSGHYEALWPTIARHCGLKVADIGGRGPFVPRARRGLWYSSSRNPELDGGTFRYRPPVADRYFPASVPGLPENHLCHPVKTAAWHALAGSAPPRLQADRAIAGETPGAAR